MKRQIEGKLQRQMVGRIDLWMQRYSHLGFSTAAIQTIAAYCTVMMERPFLPT